MKSEHLYNTPVMEEALPAVLMRVVSELHDVAYLIERIEPQLADLHPEAGQNTAERMMVLQGIDLAVQKARGLAEFLGHVTADMPEGWAVDVTTALNLVKLTDMQKALASPFLRAEHSQPINKAAGDFEAF
ncbi:hypothetical protein SAMN05892877_11541 [Rhizobium subbaraonis]|uniref:Uncharacterized protein n=1 Tax=Rhizobium subbaraonis TaxID=908946 RepID=A0A285UYM2_9HYPH|nr:hypothetical protein [Rhizobium subbaraonis]SOC45361.1 hypothetical protein SAMN05892877_11541 [Rhizobium subbaraonis]